MVAPAVASVVACLMAALTACAPVDPQTGEVLPPGPQRYSYEEVKRRLKDLEPGTSKMQTLITLGDPYRKREDVWVYRPASAGLVLPAWQLRVLFEDGQYVGHKYEPVVVIDGGQPPPTPASPRTLQHIPEDEE